MVHTVETRVNPLLIQLESDKPYIYPCTSSSHISGFKHFLSKTTKGESMFPAALQLARVEMVQDVLVPSVL